LPDVEGGISDPCDSQETALVRPPRSRAANYAAFMKALRIATSLLPLLLASYALGQTDAGRPETHASASIAAARCQYTQAESNCDTTAQAAGRIPGPRHPSACCARPGSGVAYAPVVSSAHHAVVGALVGFAVGAIIPANGSARARVSAGLIGSLFGAMIGATIPSNPSHYRRRNRWRDEDDDEDDLAQHPASTPSPGASHRKPTLPASQPQDSGLSAPLAGEP
jgi:hypothetical protein